MQSLSQIIPPSDASCGFFVYVASGHKSLYAYTAQMEDRRMMLYLEEDMDHEFDERETIASVAE